MKILLVTLLLGGFASIGLAQTNAEITGRITDVSGAVVPNTDVTVTNADKNVTRVTKSNDQGYYTVGNLEPGNYEIAAQVTGFKPVTRKGIRLDVNQAIRLDFAHGSGRRQRTDRGDGARADSREQHRATRHRHERGEDFRSAAERAQLHATAFAHARRGAGQRGAECRRRPDHGAHRRAGLSRHQRTDQPQQLLHAGRHLQQRPLHRHLPDRAQCRWVERIQGAVAQRSGGVRRGDRRHHQHRHQDRRQRLSRLALRIFAQRQTRCARVLHRAEAAPAPESVRRHRRRAR